VSSTCFEQPSVHPQEDLHIQFYPAVDQTAYIDAWKKYHKTACSWGWTLGCSKHVEDTIIITLM